MTIPQNAPIVYVSFSAEINPNTTETLIATMTNLANFNVAEVYLLLSTPGGQVMNGMNLFNVLKGLPFKLITHNVANVDSIGNAIFLAGTDRYATKNSTFMFHGVGFKAPENQRIEEKFLRERLNGILSDQTRIGNIISQQTNLTDREIKKLFREAQTKDAAFALDKGIIQEIRDVEIIAGAPIITLVFKR